MLMKKKQTPNAVLLSCTIVALLVAGCAQQQQQRKPYEPQPAVTVEVPKTEAPKAGYGPTYTTYEENGIRWKKGSMGFPTGLRESSGLLVEKTVPAEVLVGQKFGYTIKVINLTDYPIYNVSVSDRVTPNFAMADADAKPSEVRDGVATWQIGNLGGKETRTIKVNGSSAEEGMISTCAWASYSPILCEDIKIMKAALQLAKNAPAEVVICDPIPMTLTVRNTGSSPLTAVKVNDTLPEGLMSEGKTALAFDAGNMAPGESKEFKFNAMASKTGSFVNKAAASSAQGVTAEASSTTVVRQPELTVSCAAPEQRYMGRTFDVEFTVASKGDTAAVGTVLEVAVPAGLTAKSAAAGGQISAGKIAWNLGDLAPNATKQVTATFEGPAAGNYVFNAITKGVCAKQVATTCQTRVVGVSALLLQKADDPDPISVGETTTYTVRVTNQGTADDTNIKMVVEFPDEISPVSASNEGVVDGKRVTFPPYPRLAPKEVFNYTIKAKGEKVGDARVRFIRTSDGIPAPTTAEESTRVY